MSNEIPEEPIPSYFPGDDAVDWVGVNFYSVLFNDGMRDRVASWRNPSDSLRFVYDHYADKHPMMIGEWAATYMSVVDHIDRSDFAVDKIGQLYASSPAPVPTRQGRALAEHEHGAIRRRRAQAERLFSPRSPPVAAAYAKAIQPDYFLSKATLDIQSADTPAVQIQPLSPGISLTGQSVLSQPFDPTTSIPT